MELVVGFAVDVAIVVTVKMEELLTNTASRGLQRVCIQLEIIQLQFAPEKTKAVLLAKKRKLY